MFTQCLRGTQTSPIKCGIFYPIFTPHIPYTPDSVFWVLLVTQEVSNVVVTGYTGSQ